MILAGLFFLIIAAIFQGSFGLGMKNYKPFSWEAFWVLFSIVGILIVPNIWTGIAVPGYLQYILATPLSTVALGMLCGFFWGVSAIAFGKSIDSIGISLTYGICLGVSAALGTLWPLFAINTIPKPLILALTIIGTVVMLTGIVITTKAGLEKDKNSASTIKNKNSMSFGILLAIFAGLGGAAMNVGFVYAGFASNLAVQAGVAPTNASLVAWVIVLAGGFVSNFIYALIMLIKNRTYTDYFRAGSRNGYIKAVITGIIWFGALGVYGISTSLMGKYGSAIGWLGFNSLALIIGSYWGIKTGEWRGFEGPRKTLNTGNIVLIISWLIVGAITFIS